LSVSGHDIEVKHWRRFTRATSRIWDRYRMPQILKIFLGVTLLGFALRLIIYLALISLVLALIRAITA
jgi:hypothetical protein